MVPEKRKRVVEEETWVLHKRLLESLDSRVVLLQFVSETRSVTKSLCKWWFFGLTFHMFMMKCACL